MAGAVKRDIPDIDNYFNNTSLLKHGEAHFAARKSSLPAYKAIENKLSAYIELAFALIAELRSLKMNNMI